MRGVHVAAVAAYNTSKRDPEGEPFHPREAGWVGYELSVRGERLYHAGDTDVIPEMDSVTGVDVALLPVSGMYMMTAQEAAEAARRIQPRVAVPDALGRAHRNRGGRAGIRRASARGGADHGEGQLMAANGQRELLARIGEAEPELAARLVLMTLPAAAARIPGTLVYDLSVDGLGTHRVSVSGGRARVDPLALGGNGSKPELEPAAGETDFRMSAEPRALVALATGATRPLGLLLRGGVRVRGKRRRLLRLRHMSVTEIGLDEVVEAGGRLDLDAIFRSLPYAIDPDWTRGHAFLVRYELTGRAEARGTWTCATASRCG